ncbi:MAG: DNA polymerase [Candidatus Cloacimonetes bacterium]|nr:DNA polymerase [Candidatus Cloacimonadota bacterium]
MESLIHDNILFIDTESKKETGEPLYIQWRMNGVHGWIRSFRREDYYTLRSLWWQAEAVVFYGAPYDLFTVARAFKPYCSWRWAGGGDMKYWDLKIFGHHYKVRGISGLRNLIKPFNVTERYDGTSYPKGKKAPKSTPIIDLLKLWSILVDDGDGYGLKLKSLIRNVLKMETYEYEDDSSLSIEYLMQDVDRLDDLWRVFLDKMQTVDDVRGYTYYDWCDVKTPATFVKKSYMRQYPNLKSMRNHNMKQDEKHGLTDALEQAYHGGVTLALHRGWLRRTAWYDINSAYANVIKHLNTDRYLRYDWERVCPSEADILSKSEPLLCRVKSSVIFTTINSGLKMYTQDTPEEYWVWNFDIHGLSLLFPSYTWDILEAYRPVPMNDVAESMVTPWIRHKDALKGVKGKETLREYYKFMSNTSYGIKAQRKPGITAHTNMCIAGMITARAHLILFEMVDVAQKEGYRWVYSDTDSICIEYEGSAPLDLEAKLNERIFPYTCECEGYDYQTFILSLKRYLSVGGLPHRDGKPREKIKLHGKWLYDVSPEDMKRFVIYRQAPHDKITIKSLRASTETTMKILTNKSPQREEWMRPFDFDTNIEADITVWEWFGAWFSHVDKKTFNPDTDDAEAEYARPFIHFRDRGQAMLYYKFDASEDPYKGDDMIKGYEGGDSVISALFPATSP